MRNENKIRLLFLTLLITTILLITVGCNNNNSTKATLPNGQKKDVIQLMKSDKNVVDSSITKEDDMVNLKINMSKEISKEDAIKIASVYMGLAMEQYKGNNINVQILQEGKVIGGASVGK